MNHPTPVQINGHQDRICAMSADVVVHESAEIIAGAYAALYADHMELARIHGDLLAKYELLVDQASDEPQFHETLLAQLQAVNAQLDVVRAAWEANFGEVTK